MEDYFPDCHNMLSKKLASVMQAFTHLSIKNEEHDLIIRNIIESFEREMDEIVRTANNILEQQRKPDPEKKEVQEIQRAYQTLKLQYEQEKSLFEEQFNNYKKIVEDNEERQRKETQIQLGVYQKEVNELNKKVSSIIELVTRNENSPKKGRAKVEDEGEWKKKYVELEEKYNRLEGVVVQSQERLRNSLKLSDDEIGKPLEEEWGVTRIERMLKDQESIILTFKEFIERKSREKGADLINLEFGLDGKNLKNQMERVLDFERKNWEKKIQEIQTNLDSRKWRFQELENKFRSLDAENITMRNKELLLLQQIQNLGAELKEEKEQFAKKLEEEMRKGKEGQGSSLKNVERLRDDLERAEKTIEALKSKIKELESVIGNQRREVDDMKKEERARQKKENEIMDEMRTLNEIEMELERLKARYAESQKNLEEKEVRLKEVQDQLRNENEKRKEYEKIVQEHQASYQILLDDLDKSPKTEESIEITRDTLSRTGRRTKNLAISPNNKFSTEEISLGHSNFVQTFRTKIRALRKHHQENINFFKMNESALNGTPSFPPMSQERKELQQGQESVRRVKDISRTDSIRRKVEKQGGFAHVVHGNQIFSEQQKLFFERSRINVSPSNFNTVINLPALQPKTTPVKKTLIVNRKQF